MILEKPQVKNDGPEEQYHQPQLPLPAKDDFAYPFCQLSTSCYVCNAIDKKGKYLLVFSHVVNVSWEAPTYKYFNFYKIHNGYVNIYFS